MKSNQHKSHVISLAGAFWNSFNVLTELCRPPESEELEGQMLEELLQSQSDLIFVVLHS